MRKNTHNQRQFLQTAIPAGYQMEATFKYCNTGKQHRENHQFRALQVLIRLLRSKRTKRIFLKIRSQMETLLATFVIGCMCLSGIWLFLVELAEYGIQ